METITSIGENTTADQFLTGSHQSPNINPKNFAKQLQKDPKLMNTIKTLQQMKNAVDSSKPAKERLHELLKQKQQNRLSNGTKTYIKETKDSKEQEKLTKLEQEAKEEQDTNEKNIQNESISKYRILG